MQTSLSNIQGPRVPRWCFNGHMHTIVESVFNNPEKTPAERIKISTPDDDFLEVDVIDAKNENPAIALFHGLEGSSQRYYMLELTHVLRALDYSVVAVNFRACGHQMNRRRQFYHSGQTQDLAAVFDWMEQKFPHAPLGAAGFSLGGNVLLKSLGEEKDRHPLQAAVAVSVPYDLRAGSLNIAAGVNRMYQYYFLNGLTSKLEKKRAVYPDLPRFTGRTLYDFDHQVTAPLHGFQSADHYYKTCSSGQFLSDIERPVLLIHSYQDPICRPECIPMDQIKKLPNLDYLLTEQGGHVGFHYEPKGWLYSVIANYFKTKFDLPNSQKV